MIRIGFLLNHDAAHQVNHCIPTAYELARRNPDIKVVIIITTDAEREAVAGIAADYPDASCEIIIAEPPAYASLFDKLTGHAILAKRIGVLWRHRALFRSLAALVVPDKPSLILKRWLGDECPLMINTFHGAGDRRGGYQGVAGFDYHLLPGRKYEERMLEEGMVEPDRYTVAGYVKFDCIRKTPRPKLFSNDLPTVLYAPHFNPKLSSWYGWGEAILNFFENSPDYNLIFAPHVLMYRRSWHISTEGGLPKRTPPIPESALNAANILVDPGSIASIDMTYTRAADIFLGDVSSLVYEFLIEPRPCLFFNRSKANWRDNENFVFWKTGDVLESPNELPEALARAVADPLRYKAEQESAFNEAFDLNDTPSSIRAADAIVGFLEKEGRLTAQTESSSPDSTEQ
jgi:hypothetical protein